jgi:hypothetical protein
MLLTALIGVTAAAFDVLPADQAKAIYNIMGQAIPDKLPTTCRELGAIAVLTCTGNKITFLQINSKVESIPDIKYLTDLKELRIVSMPNLKSLPDEIASLQNLRHLLVFGNDRLETISPKILDLQNLVGVQFKFNNNLNGMPFLNKLYPEGVFALNPKQVWRGCNLI